MKSATLLRIRLIAIAVGLPLLSIPYFEWEDALAADRGGGGGTANRDSYLERRLMNLIDE